ncbi:hypothetical protein A4A49_01769 [Nicotiana attenuata]|uniref:Carboxypeptidase A inhibitor-like domain-containing protein n=1 Tax=Nicotiana attenuata TaxID=49451 RepID=A0A314LB00_NICAT|nr:hypothetical protein A4A49_01769 [Nicotiana attenuata]
MARNSALYFTVALMVMSVYLAHSPKVRIVAGRDVSTTITELKSKLSDPILMGGCGGYCRQASDCFDRRCPRCYYDVIKLTYGCR